MKLQIRSGVFETNSSSQHTLTIMSKEEYEKYLSDGANANLLWDIYDGRYVSKEDVIAYFNKKIRPRDSEHTFKDYTDDDIIEYMIDIHGYCESAYDCSDIITKEIKDSHGDVIAYAVSRYTPEY